MREIPGPPAEDSPTRPAVAYPDPGAVLLISVHSTQGAVAPAVRGWQIVRLVASGDYDVFGPVFERCSAARAFAQHMCPNIVGWEKISATVSAARVRSAPAAQPVPHPKGPRRRANGIRIPLWRS